MGGSTSDHVGSDGIKALSNGNYVVVSPQWHLGGAANVGAVTWANGETGRSGVVAESNSLVGSHAGDGIGSSGVAALSNGNYVVASPSWTNGDAAGVGAATWADGAVGISGPVSASNSLVGTVAGDSVALNEVAALTNGNYVVLSSDWSNGATGQVGAATWANGATGLTGQVTAANSLIGSVAGDYVGCGSCDSINRGA